MIALLLAWMAAADVPVPAVLDGVGLDPRPGAALPALVAWRDPRGAEVRLADLLDRPLLVVLADLDCHALCGTLTDGVAGALAGAGLGGRARLVVVGLDPTAPPEAALAAETRLGAATVLQGDAVAVGTLSGAVGARFRRLPDGTFAHPSVTVVVDRAGRVSGYLYGVRPEARELVAAVEDAWSGRAAAPSPSFLLACFPWTTGPQAGRVTAFLRWGGVLVLGAVGGALALLVRARGRR